MADKSYKELDVTDLALRVSTRVGMESGIKQLILRTCGFEMFNTRPYHNYETWSDGWIIMGRKDGQATTAEWLMAQRSYSIKDKDENFICVMAEDLDDAAKKFAEAIGTLEMVEEAIERWKTKK